jgi:hypothetical protein
MHIDIPEHLSRRLEQLAKGTGQDVGALVYEAIERCLTLEEGKHGNDHGSASMRKPCSSPSLGAQNRCNASDPA